MIRYRLTHRTTYTYLTPAIRARHFLHLLPRERPGQELAASRLAIEPAPASRCDETDYFGNAITSVDLDAPHEAFVAILDAIVLVSRAAPAAQAGVAWEAVAHATIPHDIAEFRVPTRLTFTDDATLARARAHFTPGADIMRAATGLTRDLHTIFRYRPGSTTTSTTGPAALAKREGVCQDFTHAMLACLRAIGLPARYVSGYLRSHRSDDAATPYSGAEQTHAWVSAWLGPALGWIDFDPTNDIVVSDDHVTLAWGRDFTDVSPTCGIILGGGRQTLKVSVVLAPETV